MYTCIGCGRPVEEEGKDLCRMCEGPYLLDAREREERDVLWEEYADMLRMFERAGSSSLGDAAHTVVRDDPRERIVLDILRDAFREIIRLEGAHRRTARALRRRRTPGRRS